MNINYHLRGNITLSPSLTFQYYIPWFEFLSVLDFGLSNIISFSCSCPCIHAQQLRLNIMFYFSEQTSAGIYAECLKDAIP